MKYVRLDLEQGTEEWKQERLKRITASQTPVLFDLSPYQTRLQLFEEKTYGKEEPVSEEKQVLFNIGHKAEEVMREYVRSKFNLEVTPAVVVSKECPELLASLDGFDESRGIIFEAKYIGQDALFDVKKGKIKAHHECQIQAQLLATGAEKCLYFGLDPKGEAAIVDIFPDNDYQARIAEEAVKFMSDVREGKEPEPSMRDFYIPDDPRFLDLKNLKLKADEIAAQFEALKKELALKYKDNPRVLAHGLTMIRSLRKGNVNYSKIPQLKGLDLDKYRGAPIETVTVRLKKESA
jgi:putative phage-type endonuclease